MVNQTFPVVYQNERFLVDCELLSKASQKFRYLMKQIGTNNKNYCLKINYNKFSTRNVSNFLKVCQDIEADVQDSEFKEICLLAKMFEAEQIFNTALSFIQKEYDASYFIPSNILSELIQSSNLQLEPESIEISQAFRFDLSDLDFDDNLDNIECDIRKKEKTHSVCYQIKMENPIMKCRRFYLIKDEKIIYMAKQRYEKIVIGEGKNCHLKNNQENVAQMTRDFRGYNIVNTREQEFQIKYLKDGPKFYVKTSFDHKNGKQVWLPIQSKTQALINGEYNHIPLKSRKNIVLKNHRNRPSFIVRKMDKKVFEVECHPDCDPIVAFSIAISQIIGPIAM